MFQAGQPIEPWRREVGGAWAAGRGRVHAGLFKHGTMTGPMRDVLHGSMLFVWGASDPAQARANEEAARAWAKRALGDRTWTIP